MEVGDRVNELTKDLEITKEDIATALLKAYDEKYF